MSAFPARAAACTVHPTAVVERGARLGEGVEVGPLAYVGPHVVLGPGCRLLPRATVLGRTTLGPECVVFPGAVVGGEPQDLKYAGEPTRLVAGARCRFREGCTANAGTVQGGGETRLGDEVLIMAGAHVAHDCRLGDRVILANGVQLGGHVVVEDDVGFGGLTAVHHYCTVGRHTFVGGMTRVVTDVPPYMIVSGAEQEVAGVNVVGLERRGFGPDAVRALKRAHRELFRRESGTVEEACARLEAEGPSEEVRILVEALRRTARGKFGRVLQP